LPLLKFQPSYVQAIKVFVSDKLTQHISSVFLIIWIRKIQNP